MSCTIVGQPLARLLPDSRLCFAKPDSVRPQTVHGVSVCNLRTMGTPRGVAVLAFARTVPCAPAGWGKGRQLAVLV